MQLKTLTIVAASLALAQAKYDNGTWGDHTKAPVLDTTTSATLPTHPVDGGKTDVADETASSTTTTWADADFSTTTTTEPVADETTSSTTIPYWGDETDVADTTSSTTTTWADVEISTTTTKPVDGATTSSTTVAYWGDETDVADTTSSTTSATWADYTPELTTTEETTVEQITKTITKGDGSEITTTLVNTKTITKTVYVTPTPVSDDQAPPAGPPKETPVLGGEGNECGVVTVTNTIVSTITVPAGGETTPTGGQFYPKPPVPPPPVVETTTEAPKTWMDAPTGFQTSAAPAPSQGGYMGIVDEWRSKMGLKALQQSSKLQSNAQDAANSSGGQLKHKLNPGSMAQVMAPGNADNFESVFVGGWLCELPNTPGLGSSVCNEMSKGWNYAGQTGHAEILTSGKHREIGCGLGDGIWTCDLA
jgi:hypothetical protein